MLFNKFQTRFPMKASGPPPDTTAPTVTITSTASGATAAAFSVTFTFSEAVTGFAVGDITVGNGSATNFAGSGTTYTADINPTATGAVTVSVGAGVCVDGAGNANTASNTFSIVFISAAAWWDFSDITTLFTDSGRTTAVTADSDPIGGVADKSGSGKHLAQTVDANRPLYKTNRQNSKSAALSDGSNDKLTVTFSTASELTFICVAKTISTAQASGRVWCFGTAGILNLYEGNPNWGFYSTQAGGTTDLGVTSRTTAIVTFKFTSNSQFNWKLNNGSYSSNIDPVDFSSQTAFYMFGDNNAGSDHSNTDMYEMLVFNSALADAAVNAIISYLNTKWAVF